MKTINKTVFIVAGASMLGLAAYLTVFINTTQVSTSNAGLFKNMMVGYDVNDGETIASYTFDNGDILKADLGPDAVSVSKEAKCVIDGSDNSKGITPGKKGEALNFTIPAEKELNLGGIDLSLDYRKSENNCSFFSRGSSFNFGVKDGKLAILFKAESDGKKPILISEVTRYEIPQDDEFRTYRFLYDPVKGKAEIFVNGVAIWSYNHQAEKNLSWNSEDQLIIGKDLKGDGTEKAFIDNITIKATQQATHLPVTLLNFEAKAEQNYVMISWYTAAESDIDSFIVERSMNAKDFVEVGRLKASGNSTSLLAYALVDRSPVTGLAYYRLAPSNKPLKSMTISLIGYKYRGANGDVKLQDVKEALETSSNIKK